MHTEIQDALEQERAGRSQAAISALEALCEAHPKNVWTHFHLGSALMRAGRLDDAMDHIDTAIEIEPKHVPSQIVRADLMVRRGEPETAVRELEAFTASHPDAKQAWDKLARFAVKAGDLDKAGTYADRMLDLDPGDRNALTLKANAALAMDDDAAAVQELLRLADAGYTNQRTYSRLLQYRDKADDTSAIDRVLRNTLPDISDSAPVHRQMIGHAMRKTDPDTLMSIIAAAPDHRFAPLMRSILEETYGLHDNALRMIRLQSPGRRDAVDAGRIIRSLLGLARYKLAYRYCRACIRRWPENRSIARLELWIYTRTGRYGNALALLEQWQAKKQEDPTFILNEELRLRSLSGDLDGARQAYAELSRMGEAHVPQQTLYLHQLVRDGALDEALAVEANLKAAADHRARAHWGTSLVGQLMNEMRLTEPDLLHKVKFANFKDMCALQRQVPRSILISRRVIGQFMERANAPTAKAQSDLIPKHIYQYWDQPDLPPQIGTFMKSWKRDGWGYTRYDRDAALNLLRTEFGPKWVQAFRMANNPAEESDLLRLCLLSRYGGVWADADDILHGSLDRYLAAGSGLVVYQDTIGGAIANNFIATRPEHPAIMRAALMARAAFLQKSGETTWFRSGPGILTQAVGGYISHCDPGKVDREVHVVPQTRILGDISMTHHAPYKFSARHWTHSGVHDPFWQELVAQAMAQSPT